MQIIITTKDGHSITIKLDAQGVVIDKEEQPVEETIVDHPELIEKPERPDGLPERPEDNWPWYFPTRDMSWYKLQETDYRDFVRSYGRELVEKELKMILLWSNANMTKRKSYRGMMRFLNSWLSRSYANAPVAKPSLTNAPQSTSSTW